MTARRCNGRSIVPTCVPGHAHSLEWCLMWNSLLRGHFLSDRGDASVFFSPAACPASADGPRLFDPCMRLVISRSSRATSVFETSAPNPGDAHGPEVPSLTCITPRALGICKQTSCPDRGASTSCRREKLLHCRSALG